MANSIDLLDDAIMKNAGPLSDAELTTDQKLKAYHTSVIQGLLGPIRNLYGHPTETDSERKNFAANVTEIMINGPDEIHFEGENGVERLMVEGEGGVMQSARFRSDEDLIALARAILQFSGKRLGPFDLSIEARTPEKHRVHIVQDPAARQGLSISIRKFPDSPLSLGVLLNKEAFTEEVLEFLNQVMTEHSNILVSGGTGSGKTTLLNGLSEFIRPDERVIIIEDTTEIRFAEGCHILQLEAQKPDANGDGGIDIRELLRASLRMRPDRIIVGECRGAEALDMVQAMNTGHPGSMSTIHANTPRDCLSRLETLCLLAGVDLPLIALQRQIAGALDIVVQTGRHKVKGHKDKRRITAISKVLGFDYVKQDYLIEPIFELRPKVGAPQDLELTRIYPT